jgi:uncharacterized protein
VGAPGTAVLSVFGLDPTASALLVVLFLLAYAVATGVVGGLLGLGGGLFVVPLLVLVFGVAPSVAIAASLIAVIATSSGSASGSVGEGLADLRIGMFLEVATVLGGVVGALVTVLVLAQQEQLLIFAFVPAVLAPALLMFARRNTDIVADPPVDRRADRFRLHGAYVDAQLQRPIAYRVTGTTEGLGLAWIAGVVSGLLGIGGGTFYVPAMNQFMNVPIRVASGTSNFMIGVTATASALIYLLAGQVALFWTAPFVIGMLIGSRLGTEAHRAVSAAQLKVLFAGILCLAAVLMALRGAGVLA